MPSLTAVDRELSKSLYDQHVQNNYHLRIAKRANLFNEMKDMDGLGKVIEELREIPKFKQLHQKYGAKIENEMEIIKNVLVNRQVQIDTLRAKASVLYDMLNKKIPAGGGRVNHYSQGSPA